MSIFDPVTIGPLTLRNGVVKSATFEGMTPGGVVSDALVEHHAVMARQDVALTTVAYGAVESSGRTFSDQLLVTRKAGLERISSAVHAEGGAVSLQLTHCGGFTKLPGAVGPSTGWNAYGLAYGVPRIRAMTESDLLKTREAYTNAAVIARDSGFDAIELHCGHGYLLSQFLSPLFNRRQDDWGRDLQGRLRFPLAIVAAIRQAVGDDIALIAKTNLDDGIAGGLGIEESVRIAEALEEAGVHAIVPSGGLVQRSAFFLLRGDVPIREMAESESSAFQRVAMRAFAPFLVKPIEYTPAFFFELGEQVRDAVSIPVGLLGGVDSSEVIDRAVKSGFAFVVMGRALLSDPDFVTRLRGGERVVSRCNHCNLCVAEMNRTGVRCVL